MRDQRDVDPARLAVSRRRHGAAQGADPIPERRIGQESDAVELHEERGMPEVVDPE
jgi:hypothetical protein